MLCSSESQTPLQDKYAQQWHGTATCSAAQIPRRGKALDLRRRLIGTCLSNTKLSSGYETMLQTVLAIIAEDRNGGHCANNPVSGGPRTADPLLSRRCP